MIISQILGGLGNQMFQYAAGRALSCSVSTNLLLDTSHFKRYKLHNGYELNSFFNIHAEEASNSDIKYLLGWRSPKLVRRLLKRLNLGALNGSNYLLQEGFAYSSRYLEYGDNTYLSGYWQSNKFFRHFDSTIRSDFSFKVSPNEKVKRILERILSCESIGVHVRRGDYVNVPLNKEIFHICGINYFSNSLHYIIKQVPLAKAFVFSDDPIWCQKNLHFPVKTEFIANNHGSNSFWDMYLLSFCKHQIISNSSFGWWASWLNNNPNKIVVAPKKWFNNNIDGSEIVPSDWHRI